MERAATQEPKRRREASALSGSEADAMVSLPYKRPRHHLLPPDTKNRSSVSSEDDDHKQNKTYAEDLVSICQIVKNLQCVEKKFHRDQQKRYENFHREQQERYDRLLKKIDDIGRWPDKRVWMPKQEVKSNKQSEGDEAKGRNMSLGLEVGKFPSDKESTGGWGADMDMGFTSSSQTATRRDLMFAPKTEYETESSQEAERSDLPQFTMRKQLAGDPNPINETEKQGRVLKLTSPSGLTARHRLNKRAPKSPIDDPSDGDYEDGGSVHSFQAARSPRVEVSRPSGLLNEDGAIEDIDIGSGFTEAEMGKQQHHSPPPIPMLSLGQDQFQSHPADPNTTPIPSRVRNTSPKSGRPLRNIKRVNYEILLENETEEENSPPPTKTTAKTPARPKPKKNPERDDGIRHQSPTKESTSKKGTTPKKNGGPKSTAGTENRSIYDFFPRESAKKPVGEDDHPSYCMPKKDDEPEPIPILYVRESGRLLPDAATKYRAVRSFVS